MTHMVRFNTCTTKLICTNEMSLGNLRQWWGNKTIRQFEERIKCFEDQYSSFEVAGEKVNNDDAIFLIAN